MHHLRAAALFGIAAHALVFASAPPTPETAAEKPVPTFLVGQIFVIGNTATPERVILDHLELYSGGRASAADLRSAERRLEKLRIFQVNRRKGIRPTVVWIIDLEDQRDAAVKTRQVGPLVRDILVDIKERPGNDLVTASTGWWRMDCVGWPNSSDKRPTRWQ